MVQSNDVKPDTSAAADEAQPNTHSGRSSRPQSVPHLPGGLSGIISIGDLLKTRIEEVETEQAILRERLLDCS